MGNKVTLIVAFSAILVLFFGMTLFDDVQAMKSKGNSLTEVSSKQVCGNFLCDEPMSIAEKIRLYLQQLSGSESTVLQQAIDPRLMINDQGLRASVQESKERQTPKTDFGAMMKKGLSKSADTVLKSANIAAPFIPGGSVVSAAVGGMAIMDIPTESGTQKIFVFAPEGIDIHALVQLVLRESYMGNLEDMKYYAEKVRYYNDVKKGMRESLTEIRQSQSSQLEYAPTGDVQVNTVEPTLKQPVEDLLISELRSLSGEQESVMSEFLMLQKKLERIEDQIVSLSEELDSTLALQKALREDLAEVRDAISNDVWPTKVMITDENGNERVIVLESVKDAYVLELELELRLTTAGDDAQLANVDLQNMLQKQQQTMQMMSNIAKQLHDTSMSIIRKIGG